MPSHAIPSPHVHRFHFSVALFRPTERLRAALQKELNLLGEHVEFSEAQGLADWVRNSDYDDGGLLVGDYADLRAQKIWAELVCETTRSRNFHLVLIVPVGCPLADIPTFGNQHIHILDFGPVQDSELVAHRWRQINAALEGACIHAKLSGLLQVYESLYLKESDHTSRIARYVQEVSDALKAVSITVYSLHGISRFVLEFWAGDWVTTNFPLAEIQEIAKFSDNCTTFPADVLLPKLTKISAQQPDDSLWSVVSTFKLAGVPGFIAYVFPSVFDKSAMCRACNFTSREIFHLLRSRQLRSQYETLKALTEIHTLNVDEDEVIWSILSTVKAYFRAEGVSIVQVVKEEDQSIRFSKTFIHFSRNSEDSFTAKEGLGHYCITKQKALLISDIVPTAERHLALGFEFAIEQLDLVHAKPVEILTVEAPKSAGLDREQEHAMMYYPLLGDPEIRAAVKIAHFSHDRVFGFSDLQALSVFAGSIRSLLTNLRAIRQLRLGLQKQQTAQRLLGQADSLFFYREISLGIFHTLANHINHLVASIGLAESLIEAKRNPEKALAPIVDAQKRASSAKSVISDAYKRGRTLTPISKECWLVRDVLRPAVEYARKADSSDILIKHTFTSDDFFVALDPEFAKECFINILNNAIWAIKAHRTAGKKEIFLAVRPDSVGANVNVEIEDSGIGMDRFIAREVAKFGPFFTTREQGTGLGLYFANKLFRHFGGDIQIARTEPKKGTTILVALPLIRIGAPAE